MNAYQMPFKNITGMPAADLAGKQYYGVKYDASGKIVLAAAGNPIVGVVQEPNNVNEPTTVMVQGISFIALGGTIAPGEEISMDANGKFVKATTAVFTGKTPATDFTLTTTKVVGLCVVGGDAGSIGSMLIK